MALPYFWANSLTLGALLFPMRSAGDSFSIMISMMWGVPPATGAAAVKVNLSAELVAEVPPGVVTVMSVCQAGSAGEVAVRELAEPTVKEVAAVAPNMTAVAPVRLVPVITTDVPPAVDPVAGLTPVIVGVDWAAAAATLAG